MTSDGHQTLYILAFISMQHNGFKASVFSGYKIPGFFGNKGTMNMLTPSHTITTSNNPDIGAFRKHCGKRRKCWNKPAFSPFPIMFSTHLKTNFNFSVAFILSSGNAFNLVQSKNLSFGKELTHYQTTNFRLFRIERLCRRQFHI